MSGTITTPMRTVSPMQRTRKMARLMKIIGKDFLREWTLLNMSC